MPTIYRLGTSIKNEDVGHWQRYLNKLKLDGYTSTSLEVMRIDTEYIAKYAIPKLIDNTDQILANHHISGLIMGSVQSGKTSSMVGLAALAMDSDFDILILLAGTRLSLWKQTYTRFMSSIDINHAPYIFPAMSIFEPQETATISVKDLYSIPSPMVERAFKDRKTIVFVCLKQVDHLRSLVNVLKNRVFPRAQILGQNLTMLIIDDEADDGSILDVQIEQNLEPHSDKFKKIPRHIENLWATFTPTETSKLFSSYTAYTATPQANFLQSHLNPLSVTDFILALRTPSDNGTLQPRHSTYREPLGLSKFYTGGDFFYAKQDDKFPLLVNEQQLDLTDSLSNQNDELWLIQSIRAFLIASAIRLLRIGDKRRVSCLSSELSYSKEELDELLPPPQTMLVHNSTSIADHFLTLEKIIRWGNGFSENEAWIKVEEGERKFSVEQIKLDMDSHAEDWLKWLAEYDQSSKWIGKRFNLLENPWVPNLKDWTAIRDIILSELIPHLSVKVINSDSSADDRPDFYPTVGSDGKWVIPNDVYTIFVSGNIMSRGITLEGLSTTLFLRESNEPIEDSQMQMQRWFGYRGDFIDLCRLIGNQRQLELFINYHKIDKGLRDQIISLMNSENLASSAPSIFEGMEFISTTKVTVGRVPLSPKPDSYFKHANVTGKNDINVTLIGRLFHSEFESTEVEVNKLIRGLIRTKTFSLLEVADLLDSLRYEIYKPDLGHPLVKRWFDLPQQLDLIDSKSPLYHGPASDKLTTLKEPIPGCPYSTAAYLRLWSSAISQGCRSLVTTDGAKRWSSLSSQGRHERNPEFYIGLRFGSGDALSRQEILDYNLEGVNFTILPSIRKFKETFLDGSWGSQNQNSAIDSYKSDKHFDNYLHQRMSPSQIEFQQIHRWRPVGSPGLLLFNITRAKNLDGLFLTFGISLPQGGPDLISAISGPIQEDIAHETG